MSILDQVTGGFGHEDTGELGRGRGDAGAATPTQSMGSSVTPHALFSREGQKVPFAGENRGDLGPADGPASFRLLTAGIDTLDLGFFVSWPDDRLHRTLERLREQATGTDGIQPEGWECLVLPSGKPPMYRYHLKYPQGELFLARSHELKNHPNVYASIAARTLWLDGVKAAVEGFLSLIEDFGGTVERVLPSRVDLAADLVIPGGLSFDFLRTHLVTSARTLRPIFKDNTLQTLYIGEGDLQVRIYDKWEEIKNSAKTFFLDVWAKGNAGHYLRPDEVTAVWRVEGQLRRPVLKEFGIESLEDMYARLAGLWTYVTDWASLRLLDDPNSARRSLHPLWQCVQSAGTLLGDPAALCRCTDSEATAPIRWYVAHMLGCLVSLAARLRLADLPEAVAAFQRLAGEYLPATAFAQRTQAEAIRLGLSQAAGPLQHN